MIILSNLSDVNGIVATAMAIIDQVKGKNPVVTLMNLTFASRVESGVEA